MTEQMMNQIFEVAAAIITENYTIAEITAKYAAYGDAVITAAYIEAENQEENEYYDDLEREYSASR